jgi:hypothetical protein
MLDFFVTSNMMNRKTSEFLGYESRRTFLGLMRGDIAKYSLLLGKSNSPITTRPNLPMPPDPLLSMLMHMPGGWGDLKTRDK